MSMPIHILKPQFNNFNLPFHVPHYFYAYFAIIYNNKLKWGGKNNKMRQSRKLNYDTNRVKSNNKNKAKQKKMTKGISFSFRTQIFLGRFEFLFLDVNGI